MNNIFRTALAVTLSAVLLTGCGWHLRGQMDAMEGVQSVHISGHNLQSELIHTLKPDLQAIDVSTVANATDAQYSIVILDERSERRTATVSASARVAEYRLTEEVDLLILATDGTQLLPRTTLSVERVFEFDEDNVLANDDEAALLKREMRNNLARQIIDRLRIASKKPVAQKVPATDATEG